MAERPTPFDGLRLPQAPLAPDPAFSADLRERLRLVLGVAGAPASDRIRHGDVVHLALRVPDERAATRFYGAVLGWDLHHDDHGHPHVVGAMPALGVRGGAGRPEMVPCFTVDDLDAALATVVAGGGQAAGDHRQGPRGTTVDCTDDQGMAFELHQAPPSSSASRPAATPLGAVAYLTVLVGDSARFRSFFSALLAWGWAPGRVADGWEPRHPWPLVGISGGHPGAPLVVPMYRVADIDGAVARVRAAGGEATDPEHQPYGISSECLDDQGTRFSLGQLAG